MTKIDCPIWGTPATLTEPTTGHSSVYDSPRAGGQYRITSTAEALVSSLSLLHKKLLTTWLCKQRRAGIAIPSIDSDLLSEIQGHRPMRFMQRVDAALLHFNDLGLPIGEGVSLDLDQTDSDAQRFTAATESNDVNEMLSLLLDIQDMGYVVERGGYAPTPAGRQRIDELFTQHGIGTQVFVAMWFDPATEDAYANGIFKAIYDSGYAPLRIDKKEHNNKIDDEIIAEIRRSRFLVADFTCGYVEDAVGIHFISRGGVYFEAGFAMALPIPVIWTCKETSIKGLHFDTRQYAHIVWKDAVDLYQQLKNRIGATLGDGPLRR